MKKFLLLLLLPSLSNAVVFTRPDPNVASYQAASGSFNPGAAPTDMCTITGSATKTVYVTSFEVWAVQTTASANQFYLVKRSTANSGGSSTAPTVVPFDSGKAAASAVFSYYTSAPTSLGTLVGNADIRKVYTATSTTATQPVVEFIPLPPSIFQPVILRGVAQSLSVNFNALAAPPGLLINCKVKWHEM